MNGVVLVLALLLLAAIGEILWLRAQMQAERRAAKVARRAQERAQQQALAWQAAARTHAVEAAQTRIAAEEAIAAERRSHIRAVS